MRTLRDLVLGTLAAASLSSAQTVIQPGLVSGAWTAAGSPYLIQGDITIQFDETLSIDPGVLVEFQGHYKLNVAGRLLAVGTAEDTITFTVHDTTGFSDRNTLLGAWHGIRFTPRYGPYDSSKITYCKLEYGKAQGPDWPDRDGGAICVESYDRLLISDCLIINNLAAGEGEGAGGGISVIRCSPKIERNTIVFNSAGVGGGINCYESEALIEHNTITYNSAQSGGGIFCNQLPGPHIRHTTVAYNQAQFGGGIHCYESSPQLLLVVIAGNTAESGGGIVCNEQSNPTITNAIVESNTAQAGGGLVCWDNCSPVLDSVAFSKNAATVWAGGGISAGNSNLQITTCLFSENSASAMGGAISVIVDTDVLGIPYRITVDKSSFLQNSANESGGLGVVNWAYAPLNVEVDVDSCEFIGNVSERYSAVDIWDGLLSISNCVFTGNRAYDVAGAAAFRMGSAGTVSNSLFASNTAQGSHSGGATVWSGASVDFMNCTFADNSALYGAGLTIGAGGTATSTNCIFWGSTAGQMALDTLNGKGGTLTINYCDVQGGRDSITISSPRSTLNWGSGNINASPDFVDARSSDYHLKESSQCIGAAVASIELHGTIRSCPPTDIEGRPRPDPSPSTPDMGAYESPYGNPVDVEGMPFAPPTEFALGANYPNPFNPTTALSFQLPVVSDVRLAVYDILGREVALLLNEKKMPGKYEVEFDASGLASGVYLYRLTAGSFVQTKKMIAVK